MSTPGPDRPSDRDAPRERNRWWKFATVDLDPWRKYPQLRWLLSAEFVATAGSMLTYVAMPFQAYRLTHSSLVVGLLGLVEVVPLIVLGLVGGAVADAMDRRRVVLVCAAALALCSVALAVNAMAGVPQLWVLFVVAGVMAVFGAVLTPAWNSILPRIVPPEDIPSTGALSWVSGGIGQAAGPLVAGVLIASVGLGWVYLIDVATALLAMTLFWRLHPSPAHPEAEPPGWKTIADGLRYARSRQELMGTYLVDMVARFFALPQALFPQMASHLGGASALGLLTASLSIGNLVASATSGWVNHARRLGRAVALAAAAWGAAIVAFGFVGNLWLAAGLLVLAGAADGVSGLMRNTIWNGSIPDRLRGRMAGIETVSFSSGPALGNVESGLAESFGGLRFAIVSGGIACVIGTAVLTALLPGFWRYTQLRGASGHLEDPPGTGPESLRPRPPGLGAEPEAS